MRLKSMRIISLIHDIWLRTLDDDLIFASIVVACFHLTATSCDVADILVKRMVPAQTCRHKVRNCARANTTMAKLESQTLRTRGDASHNNDQTAKKHHITNIIALKP